MPVILNDLARALHALMRANSPTDAYHTDVVKAYPGVAQLIKGAIDTGGWLAPSASQFGDLIATAPSRSILAAIDAVSPWRRSKPGVDVLVSMTRPAAAWRIEGQPIPVTNWNFETVRLNGNKSIAGIVVTTIEAAKELGPEFTRQIANDAASEINYSESSALLDVGNDGTGSSPPSLTSNGIIIESSGADAGSLRADLSRLLDQFAGDLSRSVWAMSSKTTSRLAMLGNELGDADVTAAGGLFAGLPACTADGAPDDQVSLIDASGTVLFDGGVSFDVSKNALLTGDDSAILNLYQGNYLGYKFVRVLDWKTGRPDSVATLAGIPWTADTAAP